MNKQPRGQYSQFEVLSARLLERKPLTEEELGATYDQMTAHGSKMTDLIPREEFIENALRREAEILSEDLKKLNLEKPKINFNEFP